MNSVPLHWGVGVFSVHVLEKILRFVVWAFGSRTAQFKAHQGLINLVGMDGCSLGGPFHKHVLFPNAGGVHDAYSLGLVGWCLGVDVGVVYFVAVFCVGDRQQECVATFFVASHYVHARVRKRVCLWVIFVEMDEKRVNPIVGL